MVTNSVTSINYSVLESEMEKIQRLLKILLVINPCNISHSIRWPTRNKLQIKELLQIK